MLIVARDVAQGRAASIWTRTRRQNLLNFAFDLKRIAGTRRPRPREFAARADDAAGDRYTLEMSRIVIAAVRRKAAEQRVARGIFIQMEWLRIIRGGEGLVISPASSV